MRKHGLMSLRRRVAEVRAIHGRKLLVSIEVARSMAEARARRRAEVVDVGSNFLSKTSFEFSRRFT